MLEATDSY